MFESIRFYAWIRLNGCLVLVTLYEMVSIEVEKVLNSLLPRREKYFLFDRSHEKYATDRVDRSLEVEHAKQLK